MWKHQSKRNHPKKACKSMECDYEDENLVDFGLDSGYYS